MKLHLNIWYAGIKYLLKHDWILGLNNPSYCDWIKSTSLQGNSNTDLGH